MSAKKFLLRIMALSVFFSLAIGPTAQAQNEQIVLSLVVPVTQEDRFTTTLIADFETQHPGVILNIVSDRPPLIEPEITNPQAYLDDLFDYVIKGDVLFVFDLMLSPTATQAEYFLNLMPLISADANLQVENYYGGLWQAYHWEDGAWAVPYAAAPIILAYDSEMFDVAGVAYPDTNWTLAQFADAARSLTQYDAQGNVIAPGLLIPVGIPEQALLRILLGQRLYDDTTQPSTPRLNTPEIVEFIAVWASLSREGVIGSRVEPDHQPAMQLVNLAVPFEPTAAIRWTLLPGGVMPMQSQAFAVNAGTNYPELAYALALFLSGRPELVGSGRVSAVRNLANNTQATGELQVVLQAGLENALPYHELLYMPYFVQALNLARIPEANVGETLSTLQMQALNTQQLALQYRSTNPPYVALPGAPPGLRPGEIALNFRLTTSSPPQQLPNQVNWDQAIEQFVAQDAEVGLINFSNGQEEPLEDLAQNFDCFTSNFNLLPSSNRAVIRNLDPLVAADSAFTPDDLLGNILVQVTYDNRVWALPLFLHLPIVIVDRAAFEQSGVPVPSGQWSISEFESALVQAHVGYSHPRYIPNFSLDNYVLPIIGAYGGLPLDYRTNPPVIGFTSPESVQAIRLFTELVKNGYIRYEPLTFQRSTSISVDETTALLDLDLQLAISGSYRSANYVYLPYPTGTQFSIMPYGLSLGYISASTPAPEACYRWLAFIRGQPELFPGMPTYHSALQVPSLAAAHGTPAVAFYERFALMLEDPTVIFIPTTEQDIANAQYVYRYWLYNALDRHLLEGGNLESLLQEAQTKTQDFAACAALLPPIETGLTRAQELVDCGRSVDSNFPW